MPETRKLESFHETKTRVREDSSLCPETSTKNTVQEFYPWCRSTPAAAPGSPGSSPSGSARNSCSTCTTHSTLLSFRCPLPVFRIRIHLYGSGSGHSSGSSLFGWTLIRIQVFRWQKSYKKFVAENFFSVFWSKTTICLSLGLHKGRPN